MMGSLHNEFVVEAMLRKLLDCSGFTEIIKKAGVLSSGRSESVVSGSGSHLKHVHYTHQVFLAACMILSDEAYEKYLTEVGPCDREIWENKMKDESQMFCFLVHGESITASLFSVFEV